MQYVRHALFLATGLLLAALPLGCDSTGPSGGAPGAPSPPTSLTATAQDGSVELAWDGVDDADTYNVYRASAPTDSAAGEPLATDVSGTTYTDDTPQNGMVYYYRVTAVTDSRESAGSGEAAAEMPAADPGGGGADDAWTRVKTSVDNTIYDVAHTTAGAYAVAGGGILLTRQDTSWVKVLNDGPSSNGSDLYGLDVTADSTRLWLVGASGAIGEYDVTTSSLTDRSQPMDVSNNFRGVAVTGESGSARVTIVGASGKVYYSASNGETGTWNEVTPGSGAGLRAVDFYAGTEGHLLDGSQTVFATTDGTTFSDIGIANADVGFRGVDADASDDVWVAGDGGTVRHWNGSTWSATDLGDPGLMDVEVAGTDQSGYVAGKSGAIFAFDGVDWTRQETPTGQNLRAIVQGDPAIAVGASGTVLER
jgi:hypothetical protein